MKKQVLFVGSYTPNDKTGGALGTFQILQSRNKKDIWLNTNFINDIEFNCLRKLNSKSLNLFNYLSWKILSKFKFFYLSSNSEFLYLFISSTIKFCLKTYLTILFPFLEKKVTLFISLDDDFIIENEVLVKFFKKKGSTIVTRIADDPICSMILYNRSELLVNKSRLLVKNILSLSDSVFVVSDGMKTKFENEYSIKSTLTYPLNNVKIGKPKIKNNKKLSISHFGHLRLNEISNVNKLINYFENNQVNYEINFIGRSKSYYNKIIKNNNLNFKGWVSDSELNEIINKTDFGYVPYSFDENFKNFTTTSFPNKVTTLTKKYIPIIAHSPSYSTLSKFVDKYKIGINLEKLNVEDLHNKIFILEKNIDKLYKNMKYINENLFDNNMIVDKYRKSFDE